MLLTRQSVELLAPAGTWEVLEAAIAAGADAVYLGGKRFNMRLHRTDTNFDDEKLARAIKYAHDRNVRLYVTVNNLISERELPGIREYLKLLDELQPDALIVQDFAILELAREMNLSVPLHASVMMNTHNERSIKTLMDYGITRVVTNRELTLTQLTLLKERTGIELEYFIHGDMCAAHSGQCLHSGIVFGQSSNRGRCLKPCRWQYQLVDTESGKPVTANDPGPYKLALKDMCMYTALPELIQSGVCSFKIEGRMRTADFVSRIVRIYRKAIDRYIADPTGYSFDTADWQELFDYRSRDFSTCYALGNPSANSMGYTGEREPRFFSQAVKEAGLTANTAIPALNIATQTKTSLLKARPSLAVRVACLDSLHAALENGADTAYIGGEAFRPNKPWTLQDIETAVNVAENHQSKVIVTTPRITMERESAELEQLFVNLDTIKPHGLMVSNSGMLRLAREYSNLPVQADFSFNLFNHLTSAWLKANGASKATLSLEATYEQIAELAKHSPLPLEMIIHGATEAMVLDHCIPSAVIAGTTSHPCQHLCADQHFSLLDTAGERHDIKIDQYCRNHILFAKDLCLLPHLPALLHTGINNYRIEGQHYTPELVGTITAMYRSELDKLYAGSEYTFDQSLVGKIAAASPRQLGIGAFRYRISR